MNQESRSSDKRRLPPYGPVKGMVEGLQILQRLSPAAVDEALLRANRVAPNNEYKVVGALRYLDLIDDEGKPTEKSRLLKTRGATYMLNLQEIVRSGYADLFRQVSLREDSRDRIYNFFVTEAKMGSEMATKATRFFLELCRIAGFEMGPGLEGNRRLRGSDPRPTARAKRPLVPREAPAQDATPLLTPAVAGFPIVLAVTPEMVSLEEEDFERFFRRMLRAWRRVSAESAD